MLKEEFKTKSAMPLKDSIFSNENLRTVSHFQAPNLSPNLVIQIQRTIHRKQARNVNTIARNLSLSKLKF
jgi:hypothetical protein